ncbi:hypothetical protein Tco_1120886 [Tanacetum coccineum]|uniref:Uncharacterized protein n=1 Tax=Tanacetum coccineum TaxID=301880 RepID=A0ABQ5IWH7_9ASTR
MIAEDLRTISSPSQTIGILLGMLRAGKAIESTTREHVRLRKQLSLTFEEMHQSMAPLHSMMSSATKINAQVVPPGTSLSTTIAQDAPSTSASSSTSDIHLPVQHQEIA